MRRVAVAALCVAILVGAALVASGAGGSSGGYRVDALFDNASFLIPGQDVKIAGARVGEVVDVKLTADNRARIQMAIDPEFAPFRSDADCTIQPQSLIGEKFLQCTPGTPRGRALVGRDGDAPTVPLANTHAPVDLDLVFATFRFPTNQRLALLVNELGAGLAGRGDDLNAAIRRANPALLQTRRVLRIAAQDRRRLRALITATTTVVSELARRRGRVRDVIDTARVVAGTTARRRAKLEAAVRDLPALLTEAEPSLRSLQGLARDGAPVLDELRAAAPSLTRLARAAPPLADAARPALTRLGSASRVGRRALNAARPVVNDLRGFARAALPAGRLLSTIFASLRRTGTVEGLQDFVYYGALTTSRFDELSHIIPAHLLGSECTVYATAPSAACDATFARVTGATAPAAKRRSTRTHRAIAPAGRDPAPAPSQPSPAPAPSAPIPSTTTTPPDAPPPSAAPEPRDPVQGLLDYLLG